MKASRRPRYGHVNIYMYSSTPLMLVGIFYAIGGAVAFINAIVEIVRFKMKKKIMQ